MATFAELMMERFQGLDKAHGLYKLVKTGSEKEGQKILGTPSTVKDQVDLFLWEKHCNGSIGIGIVPIMDDSNCFFGAIDVDIYTGLDLKHIANEIKRLDLPLIPCRTKSGGVHCYCFVKEKVKAIMMREKLSLFASILGFGDCEIFPKQTEILAERGDIGQWINMPYYNGEETDRYGIHVSGRPLKPMEFIAEIDAVRMTYLEFKSFSIALVKEIEDGPPCLQHILTQKFHTGNRNDGFFNLAIYLKKSEPDTWDTLLDDYNQKFVDPPLSSSEVQNILKSLKKREYLYTCTKAPIKNHCDSAICKTRKFGIGASTFMKLTGLTKYDSNPPIWFLDVENHGRLELSTEDMQSQQKFQRRCMENLNIMPPSIPVPLWRDQISALLENVNVLEASVDSSPKGLLFEYLEKFCTSRVQGRSKDEILLGKPWSDDHYHWFRMSDFYSFLERARFKDFKINQICSIINDYGGKTEFIKIKGKGLNIWKVPCFEKQTEGFTEPSILDKNVL